MAAASLDLYKSMAGACARVGLLPDVAERFARAQYFPLPKQLYFHAAAHECDVKSPDAPTDVGLGGARGGAKSHGVLAQLAIDDCQRQDELKCLWLRQVGIAAKEALEDLIPKVIKFPHHYVSSPVPTITFPNKSRILVGHFKNESDITRYLGLEYDVIATEEATQLSASKNSQIGTCLRTAKPNWRPRRYYTTNPGGIGHAWFKKMFIEPFRKGLQTFTRFIFSTFRDNPYLNPEYLSMLNRLTGWLKRAWRDGDWDIASGQFFSTWRHDRVVKPAAELDEIPPGAHAWGGFDYGFTHPTTFYLLTEYDGKKRIIDEYREAKKLIPQNAAGIKQLLARHGLTPEDLWVIAAGDDVFRHTGDRGGLTFAQQYKEEGIKLSHADMDRINGAGEFLKLLGDPDNGIEPKLEISDRCAHLIECIPSLQHDPHRPEDVLKVDVDDDGEGGDDPYDGARYGLRAKKRKLTAV